MKSKILSSCTFGLVVFIAATLAWGLFIGHPDQTQGITVPIDIWAAKPMVAHALGGYNGLSYTNSIEALESNYAKGFRFFEMDLYLTTDSNLIGFHETVLEANAIKSTTYFMQDSLNENYTIATLDQVLDFMLEHTDMYLIIDTKDGPWNDMLIYEVLTKKCLKKGSNVIDRIIPQVYSDLMYEKNIKDYNFHNIIYSIYKEDYQQDINIIRFLELHGTGIQVVTIPEKRATEEFVQELKALDKLVYVHTINTKSAWSKYKALGVDGIYTDKLH